jgi:hypothetical protein
MAFILIKIGRKSGNDIVLNSSSVSGYHAELFMNEDGVVFLTDLNSTNGTYVNGNRVQGSVLLKKGDILKLGFDKPSPWLTWIERKQAEMSGALADPLTNPQEHIKKNSERKFNYFEILLTVIIGILICLIIYFVIRYKRKDEGKVNLNNESSGVKISDSSINSKDSPNVNRNKPEVIIPDNRTISYNYECLGNDFLDYGNTIKKELLEEEIRNVTIATEIAKGNELHQTIKSDYQIITSGNDYERLKDIFDNLIMNLPGRAKFNYKLFIIKTDDVNAFTCGGRVYVSTGIIDFCESDDELACILGHEIYHNEKGHLKEAIALSNIDASGILSNLSIAFDQKNELECDLHGIDLAINTRYEACAIVDFWQRMHLKYDEKGEAFEDFFRSHPYSDKRSACAKNHILRNYSHQCK